MNTAMGVRLFRKPGLANSNSPATHGLPLAQDKVSFSPVAAVRFGATVPQGWELVGKPLNTYPGLYLLGAKVVAKDVEHGVPYVTVHAGDEEEVDLRAGDKGFQGMPDGYGFLMSTNPFGPQPELYLFDDAGKPERRYFSAHDPLPLPKGKTFFYCFEQLFCFDGSAIYRVPNREAEGLGLTLPVPGAEAQPLFTVLEGQDREMQKVIYNGRIISEDSDRNDPYPVTNRPVTLHRKGEHFAVYDNLRSSHANLLVFDRDGQPKEPVERVHFATQRIVYLGQGDYFATNPGPDTSIYRIQGNGIVKVPLENAPETIREAVIQKRQAWEERKNVPPVEVSPLYAYLWDDGYPDPYILNTLYGAKVPEDKTGARTLVIPDAANNVLLFFRNNALVTAVHNGQMFQVNGNYFQYLDKQIHTLTPEIAEQIMVEEQDNDIARVNAIPPQSTSVRLHNPVVIVDGKISHYANQPTRQLVPSMYHPYTYQAVEAELAGDNLKLTAKPPLKGLGSEPKLNTVIYLNVATGDFEEKTIRAGESLVLKNGSLFRLNDQEVYQFLDGKLITQPQLDKFPLARKATIENIKERIVQFPFVPQSKVYTMDAQEIVRKAIEEMNIKFLRLMDRMELSVYIGAKPLHDITDDLVSPTFYDPVERVIHFNGEVGSYLTVYEALADAVNLEQKGETVSRISDSQEFIQALEKDIASTANPKRLQMHYSFLKKTRHAEPEEIEVPYKEIEAKYLPLIEAAESLDEKVRLTEEMEAEKGKVPWDIPISEEAYRRRIYLEIMPYLISEGGYINFYSNASNKTMMDTFYNKDFPNLVQCLREKFNLMARPLPDNIPPGQILIQFLLTTMLTSVAGASLLGQKSKVHQYA